MDAIHDYIHYCFAGIGLWLAVSSPVAGASIVAVSLCLGVARVVAQGRDTRRAKEIVEGLQSVVNSNAKRLEQVIMDFEKLSGEFEFSKTARGFGVSR